MRHKWEEAGAEEKGEYMGKVKEKKEKEKKRDEAERKNKRNKCKKRRKRAGNEQEYEEEKKRRKCEWFWKGWIIREKTNPLIPALNYLNPFKLVDLIPAPAFSDLNSFL